LARQRPERDVQLGPRFARYARPMHLIVLNADKQTVYTALYTVVIDQRWYTCRLPDSEGLLCLFSVFDLPDHGDLVALFGAMPCCVGPLSAPLFDRPIPRRSRRLAVVTVQPRCNELYVVKRPSTPLPA
jgi:hypothetical protein